MRKIRIVTLDKYIAPTVDALHAQGLVQISDISDSIQQDPELAELVTPAKATKYSGKLSSLLMKTNGISELLGNSLSEGHGIKDTLMSFISPDLPVQKNVEDLVKVKNDMSIKNEKIAGYKKKVDKLEADNKLKSEHITKINSQNELLMKKDLSVYKKIGYFAGNLMHCLVEYGKKMKKGVNSKNTFYKGLNLNIIDLLEFLKNRNFMITFPYFLSTTDKINLAEIFSKRNVPEKARKEKEFYSVIMKISYLYENGYEPSIFDLKGLSQYPDEEDYYLLPFTFLNLNKFTIDSNKYTADIEFLVIGKKEI